MPLRFNLSLSAAASVMFGVPLTELCKRESSTVPIIVRRIIKHIEDEGLDQEGIYRINGNTRIIDKLKIDFDKGEIHELVLFLGLDPFPSFVLHTESLLRVYN